MNTPTVSHTTINDELRARLAALLNMVDDGMSAESLRLNTNVTIEVRGEDGELKDKRELHNMVVTAGKNKLLAATSPSTVNSFAYIATGTGTTAPTLADTTLGVQVVRSAGTTSNPTAAQWQVTYTFAAGTSVGAITESGLFDASSGGNMLARQTFAAVNVGSSDTLAITWVVS